MLPTQPGGSRDFLFFSSSLFILLNSIHSFSSFKFNSNSIQIQFKFEPRFLTTPASSSHARSARHALPGQVGPGQGRSHGLLAWANQLEGRHGWASATIRLGPYVNATKESAHVRTKLGPGWRWNQAPQRRRERSKIKQNQKRKSKQIKENPKTNPKKREKSLFDPGRHFPVPYFARSKRFEPLSTKAPTDWS